MLGHPTLARGARRELWLGAAAWLLIASCGALPDTDYRTDSLDVAVLFDAGVCAGSLWQLEQSATRISEELSLDRDDIRLRVYWGSSGLSRYCDAEFDDIDGCYAYEDDAIFGRWSALDHEMVHSFAARINRTDTAFEEGLAIALSDSAILDQDFSDIPDQYLGLSVTEFHQTIGARHTVGHFVRWLIDERQIEPLLQMRREVDADADREQILDSFQKFFGRSMLDLEVEWALHAPEGYEGGHLPATTPLNWKDGRATLSRTLDCDEQTTFGPLTSPPFGNELDEEPGMYAIEAINITSPGNYRVTLSGNVSGSAVMKQSGCWVTDDESSLVFEIAVDESQVLALSACTWTVHFRTHGYTATELRLEFEQVAT